MLSLSELWQWIHLYQKRAHFLIEIPKIFLKSSGNVSEMSVTLTEVYAEQ